MISRGAQIDSTARVAAGARIGQDVAIGPYCVIGPDVAIGDGCKLESHVCVSGNTTIGAGTIVSPFAVLARPVRRPAGTAECHRPRGDPGRNP
jgi:UDP-N-acetylglucosamine acyltransferase